MSQAYEADYQTEEWKALRQAILDRDGWKCRNCGSKNNLQVHHWLPVQEHQNTVDSRGYSLSGDPLIVHESGLVTLCYSCHKTLTQIRSGQEVLNDDELNTIGSRPNVKPRNIFELWAISGKKTPFRVRRRSWNIKVMQFVKVEKVEVDKWPYGKAWGRYCRDGEYGDYGPVRNAGTYSWELFIDRYDEEAGEWWSGDTLVAARSGPRSIE